MRSCEMECSWDIVEVQSCRMECIWGIAKKIPPARRATDGIFSESKGKRSPQ